MKKYRGRTEAERIECALKTRDLEQAIEFLAGVKLLTQPLYDTLQECRSFYCEDLPDAEPGDLGEVGRDQAQAVEPEPVTKVAATRKMRQV